jgi:hypothetical protein
MLVEWRAPVPACFFLITMQADFAVELGRDDETLELPWAAPDGRLRYHDLKRDPEALAHIEEATLWPELREALIAFNAQASMLESAKCDAWATTELNPEEDIFGVPWKFASYIDLLISDPTVRFSFEKHETFLQHLIGLLKVVPEIPASAEFCLRRCFYHEGEVVREGYYMTFYLFGYGEDEARARKQWGIALKLVSAAITQLSSRHLAL